MRINYVHLSDFKKKKNIFHFNPSTIHQSIYNYQSILSFQHTAVNFKLKLGFIIIQVI